MSKLRLHISVMPLGGQIASKKLPTFLLLAPPEATLKELSVLIFHQHVRNYPNRPLLHIKKLQDSDESDIDLSYLVGDVFRDKDVVKVIQSPPERESSLAPQSALRPHIPGVPARRRYVENGFISEKAAGLSSEAARQPLQSQYAPITRDSLNDVDGSQRPHKRQRIQERSMEPKHAAFDLNRPLPTREHVSPELGGQEPPPMLREFPSSLSLIEDSQRSRDVPQSHLRADYERVSLNQLTGDAWTVPDSHMSPPPPWQNHNSASQQPIRDEDIESAKSESSDDSKVLHSVPRSALNSHPGEFATRVTQETDVMAPSLHQPTISLKNFKPIQVQSNGNHERSFSTASTTPLPPNQLTLMSRTRSETSIQPYPVATTSDISPQVVGPKSLAPTSDHVVLNPMEMQVKLSQTFRSPSHRTSPSANDDVDMLAEEVQVPSTAQDFVEVNPLQRPMASKEHQISQRPDTARPSGPLSEATRSDRTRAIDGKQPLISRAKRSAPSTKLETGPSKTRKTKLRKVDEGRIPDTVNQVGLELVASAYRDKSHEGNREHAAPLLGVLQNHFRREKTLSVEGKQNTLQSSAMPPTDTKPINGNAKEGKKLSGIPLYPRPLSMHGATPARPANARITAVLATPPAMRDVGIEAQMPLPPSLRRSVSFACEDPTFAQKPPASPKACQDGSRVVSTWGKRSSKAVRGHQANLTLGPSLRSASPVAYGKPFVSPGNPVTVIPTVGQESKVYPPRVSAETPERVTKRAKSNTPCIAPKLPSDAVKRKRVPPVTGTKPMTVTDGDAYDAMVTRTSTKGVSIIISSDDEKSVSSYYSSDSDTENPEKAGQIGKTMIAVGGFPALTSKSADGIVKLEPSTTTAAAVEAKSASPMKEERAPRSASASASTSPSKDYTISRSPARYMSDSPLRSRSMEVPASEDEDEDHGQLAGSRLSFGSPKLPKLPSPSPTAISEVDVSMREDSAVSDEGYTSSDPSTDNDDEDERASSADLPAPSRREVSKPPLSQSQARAKDLSSLQANGNQGWQVPSHSCQIQLPPSSSVSAAPPTRPHAASRFPSLTALIGTNNSSQHDDSSSRTSPRPAPNTNGRVTYRSAKLQYPENTSTTPSAFHRSLENRALSVIHNSEHDGNQASDSDNSTSSSSSMSDDDDAEEEEDEKAADLVSRHATSSLSRGQQMIEVPPSSTKGKGRLSRLFTSLLPNR